MCTHPPPSRTNFPIICRHLCLFLKFTFGHCPNYVGGGGLFSHWFLPSVWRKTPVAVLLLLHQHFFELQEEFLTLEKLKGCWTIQPVHCLTCANKTCILWRVSHTCCNSGEVRTRVFDKSLSKFVFSFLFCTTTQVTTTRNSEVNRLSNVSQKR